MGLSYMIWFTCVCRFAVLSPVIIRCPVHAIKCAYVLMGKESASIKYTRGRSMLQFGDCMNAVFRANLEKSQDADHPERSLSALSSEKNEHQACTYI